jgi:hypothetical protein
VSCFRRCTHATRISKAELARSLRLAESACERGTLGVLRDERDLLSALVAADEAAGEAELFVLTYTGNGPVIIGHRGWPEDAAPPSSVEVDRLAERGWVSIERADGKGRAFAVMIHGREAASAYSRQRSAARGSAVALDWSVVNPVLEAFYDAYTEAGAPEHGVESEPVLRMLDDPAAARASLRELVRGGYLEEITGVDQSDIPGAVRPTPATLQLLARWPGSNSEAALAELVSALDQAIESTPAGEKRTVLVRVRDGLIGAARDVALSYLERKVGG